MKPILLAGLFGLMTSAVFAHPRLSMSTPENGAVLTAVPTHVLLTFETQIRLTKIEMTHQPHRAIQLDLGDQKAFATEFVVPLTRMGKGQYRIEWRGLAIDGHVMRGDLTFHVE